MTLNIQKFFIALIMLVGVTSCAPAQNVTTTFQLTRLTPAEIAHTRYDSPHLNLRKGIWSENLKKSILFVIAPSDNTDPSGLTQVGENDFIFSSDSVTILEDSTSGAYFEIVTVGQSINIVQMTFHVPQGQTKDYINVHGL